MHRNLKRRACPMLHLGMFRPCAADKLVINQNVPYFLTWSWGWWDCTYAFRDPPNIQVAQIQ